MNEFDKVDDIGQKKVINIIDKLFNNYKVEQHLEGARTDIDMTAYTQTSAVTYTIECKDRWNYTTTFLYEKGAMIEIEKFNSLQNKRVENHHNRAIYFNTTSDGYVVYDLTNVKHTDLNIENLKRKKSTLHPEWGYKYQPCYVIPNKYIVKMNKC